VRAKALMVLEALQEQAWFHKVGVTDDGGVMLFHEMPGRLLKQVANESNVAFISATLSIADSRWRMGRAGHNGSVVFSRCSKNSV